MFSFHRANRYIADTASNDDDDHHHHHYLLRCLEGVLGFHYIELERKASFQGRPFCFEAPGLNYDCSHPIACVALKKDKKKKDAHYIIKPHVFRSRWWEGISSVLLNVCTPGIVFY